MLQPSELRKEKDMRINVHAGHNPDGKIACGAIGFIRESTEARKVKDEVIAQLRQMGHTVYDCTCNSGTGQLDVLEKIVSACNTHKVDLDVSIHFNAGVRDNTGNGRTTGTEVMIYNNAGRAREAAERKKKQEERKKADKKKPKPVAKKDNKAKEKTVEPPSPKKNLKEMDGQLDMFSMMGM